MSSMTDQLMAEQLAQHGTMQFAITAPTFRIKRPGARPLIFEGVELAMAMSFTPSLPNWYEVNLYRTSDQRFVVAVRLFFQSEAEQDQIRAWDFETLDQALEKLSQYDAGQDVRVSLDQADLSLPPAELAAMALELRARVDSARRHFASLLGEFFFELDTIKVPVPRGRA
ncbi:hypothetical protein [Pseudorhodobacter sp. MZDSW-24AT]|uniref:hypothetical protein n=1 Tax=Pseudorhodobacter sp. MZDSW-24AT TaxID=2052957 RepID=UPI000CC581AB|nr:hypothetical protein [Pseudorhodobacter sp. MZDSW-24AT]PJF08878.1 hypothetical protein CUR21_10365 [Pseudorhodobacter sp. MZDSW-24AT]